MRSSRHGTILRVQVGFMLAFYALALCRGLIPGLCATLAETDVAPARIKIAAGCCSQASDSVPATTSSHCAFCSLMTTASQAVDCPVVPPAEFVDRPDCLDGLAAPDIAIAHDPILRRGPPVFA